MKLGETGSIVALVTPMKVSGELDYDALCSLIDWQIEAGTEGLLVLGSTGESPTIHGEERDMTIAVAVQHAAGRVPVIVGTGTNDTRSTCQLTERAARLGASAALVVTPYYNKPTQTGLIAHFEAVAEVSPIPLIVYDVPSRTGVHHAPETLAQILMIPNVVGVKDATGDLSYARRVRQACNEYYLLFSGDDATANTLLQHGADGVISVVANVAPGMVYEMVRASRREMFDAADDFNDYISGLHKACFVQSNPIPVKWALHRMGLIAPGIRLPMTWLEPQFEEQIEQAMREAEIRL